MINILLRTLVALLLTGGIALTVPAQRNDNRDSPPPKNDRPKVNVPPKNDQRPPRDNNNDNSNKPKKPAAEFADDRQFRRS